MCANLGTLVRAHSRGLNWSICIWNKTHTGTSVIEVEKSILLLLLLLLLNAYSAQCAVLYLASSQVCYWNWQKEINHNIFKNPNWGLQRNRGGHDPTTIRFQVRRPNHSATLPLLLLFRGSTVINIRQLEMRKNNLTLIVGYICFHLCCTCHTLLLVARIHLLFIDYNLSLDPWHPLPPPPPPSPTSSGQLTIR